MEVDEELQDTKDKQKKHHMSQSYPEIQSSENIKKVRLFSAKEFRKNLHSDDTVAGMDVRQFKNIGIDNIFF